MASCENAKASLEPNLTDLNHEDPLITRLLYVLVFQTLPEEAEVEQTIQNCWEFLLLFTKAFIAQHSSQKTRQSP